MYRGFQLKLRKYFPLFGDEFECCRSAGEDLFEEHQNEVKSVLDDFLLSDGSIDGSKMQENWFPQIKADIFISHSHQDKDLAMALAGWLCKKFRLKSFIDSCVWGYADDLKELLCQTYRKHSYPRDSSLHLFVSSHVDMMLSVALNQMIDNTECLFFLNTPNSISFDAPVCSTTSSPWIYSEIAMSRLIRKQVPERLKRLNESQDTFSKKLIRYRLPMDHLPIVNEEDMSKWEVDRRLISYFEKSYFLDKLYKLVDKKAEQKIRSLK